MEINVILVVIGILVWPELTLCAILWKLGYPWLGIFALVVGSSTSVKQIVRTRIVDSRGNVIKETVEKE